MCNPGTVLVLYVGIKKSLGPTVQYSRLLYVGSSSRSNLNPESPTTNPPPILQPKKT